VPVLRRDRFGRPAPPGTAPEATLPPQPLPSTAGEAFEAGIRLFDAGRFFEAHELFEHVWRSPEVDPTDRPFWKGVTQVAVGFCHVQRGNAWGALALLGRAVRNLDAFPSPHRGVDTRALVAAARFVADAVRTRAAGWAPALPAFPRAP
jgi:predicted metal-dependent hydrolase